MVSAASSSTTRLRGRQSVSRCARRFPAGRDAAEVGRSGFDVMRSLHCRRGSMRDRVPWAGPSEVRAGDE